jgi:succinyl-diaminopimelate desuccinylase
MMHLRLQATGTSTHNSRPWLGDNAIEKVMRVYDRMKHVCASAAKDDTHWHETVSIGKITGGEFVNQVPAYAEALVDVRFTEKHTCASMHALLESCLEDGVQMMITGSGECFHTDEQHPMIRSYMDAMQAQGLQMRTTMEHGATDARFFTKFHVPIWIHAPLGGGLHTDDEWLDLASAERVLNGLKEFCSRPS